MLQIGPLMVPTLTAEQGLLEQRPRRIPMSAGVTSLVDKDIREVVEFPHHGENHRGMFIHLSWKRCHSLERLLTSKIKISAFI